MRPYLMAIGELYVIDHSHPLSCLWYDLDRAPGPAPRAPRAGALPDAAVDWRHLRVLISGGTCSPQLTSSSKGRVFLTLARFRCL